MPDDENENPQEEFQEIDLNLDEPAGGNIPEPPDEFGSPAPVEAPPAVPAGGPKASEVPVEPAPAAIPPGDRKTPLRGTASRLHDRGTGRRPRVGERLAKQAAESSPKRGKTLKIVGAVLTLGYLGLLAFAYFKGGITLLDWHFEFLHCTILAPVLLILDLLLMGGKRAKATAILLLPVLLVGFAVAGFFIKTRNGETLWTAVLREVFGIGGPPPKSVAGNPEKPRTPMEQQYFAALGKKVRAEFYVNGLKIREEKLDSISLEDVDGILKELEEQRGIITGAIEEMSSVLDEINKPEGTTQASLDNLDANNKFKELQALRPRVGKVIDAWKEHRETVNRRLHPEEPKPEEPKPEPPKPEEPKPEEPKPEEPKPVEPKPEEPKPEEPKPVEPKPVEPKPEEPRPEEPKPVEPKPEEPKPVEPKPEEPKPEEPKPAAARLLPEPWTTFPAGAWARYRTVTKTAGMEMKGLVDYSLKEVQDRTCIVSLEQLTEPSQYFSSEVPFPRVAEVRVVGTETLDLGGTLYSCQVQEYRLGQSEVKAWVIDAGEFAGRATAKVETRTVQGETAQTSITVLRAIRNDKIVIGGREIDCLFLETQTEQPGGSLILGQHWSGDGIPGLFVKTVSEWKDGGSVTELTEFGKEASTRPPFPKPEAPKPVEPKPVVDPTAEAMKKADAEIQAAVPLFKEVSAAVNQMPEDKTKIQELLDKSARAQGHLGRARDQYRSVRDQAADPASVDKRIAQIEGLLKKLEDYSRMLRERL